jgi:chromosome segregation ATPase
MRYILGYVALMLILSGLGMLISGDAFGFFLLLIAAGLIYLIIRLERERRRTRRYGDYRGAIEGYEKHFAGAKRELEAKLPPDALDSPALVELLSAEGAAEADAIREEYGRLRQRFVAWQEEFERLHAQRQADAIGLPARFVEHYDELDRQLAELLAEVARLEARAAEADRAADNPLEEIARAALKLEEAKATCRRAFGDSVPTELDSELAVGGEKLEQARGGLAKGAERPLAAARLAREVFDLAAAVESRAQELVRLPAELSARRDELNRTCDRLDIELPDAKAKVAAAAELYAPSCLLAIRGFGAAAEQALEHARVLIAKQPESADTFRLDEAAQSLTRAEELVGRIEHHLAALGEAALEARENVEQAELEIDRAWASITAASAPTDALTRAERVVARARELASDARKELEQPRPDWFRTISLAKRATDVVEELDAARAPTMEKGPTDPHGNVELARARAEAALAEARPLATIADGPFGMDNMTSLFLERGEDAYAKAVALQRQLGDADDPEALTHAVLDGFRLAEDAAAAAQEHALGLRDMDGTKSSGRTTVSVVWGTFGTAAFRSD